MWLRMTSSDIKARSIRPCLQEETSFNHRLARAVQETSQRPKQTSVLITNQEVTACDSRKICHICAPLGPKPLMYRMAWLREKISNSHFPLPGWKYKMKSICSILICLVEWLLSRMTWFSDRKYQPSLDPGWKLKKAVVDAAAC